MNSNFKHRKVILLNCQSLFNSCHIYETVLIIKSYKASVIVLSEVNAIDECQTNILKAVLSEQFHVLNKSELNRIWVLVSREHFLPHNLEISNSFLGLEDVSRNLSDFRRKSAQVLCLKITTTSLRLTSLQLTELRTVQPPSLGNG